MSAETKRMLCVLLATILAPVASAAEPDRQDSIRIELNTAELVQNRCRISFVVKNSDAKDGLESLKLDLAVFGRDGAIQRRLVAEFGPIRSAKTIVKAFELDGDCNQIGSVLVNDVTACVPGHPNACIDRLVLESRLPNIRLFK